MLESSTTTKFAVARKNKIISDGYADVETAKRQLAYVEESMTSVGLTPDVHIVTVQIDTIVGKHEAYKESVEDEAPEAEQEQPPAEQGS